MVELNGGLRKTILSFFVFNLVLIRFCIENDEKIGKSTSHFSVVEESRRIVLLKAFRNMEDLVRAFLRHELVYQRGQSLCFDFFEDFFVKFWVG